MCKVLDLKNLSSVLPLVLLKYHTLFVFSYILQWVNNIYHYNGFQCEISERLHLVDEHGSVTRWWLGRLLEEAETELELLN